MIGTPTSPSNRTRGRSRGQSDVLAIVLLFGMVFFGAGIVLLAGGMLVGGVQDSSQQELAGDIAAQTHDQIQQALTTQSPRELPGDAGSVQQMVVEGGAVQIEMYGGGVSPCTDDVDQEMGAIVHETETGRIVYEGGALWEETEAGWTIRRHPSLSYDADNAQISLQLVSAAGDQSLSGGTVTPDEERQAQVQRNVSRMLTRCPAQGHTDLRIEVTSEYDDLWLDHFEQRVNTSANVTISRSGNTVRAEITNATHAHASRDLRFDDISAPTVVSPASAYPDHFNLTTRVANDGFQTRNATVRLTINGTIFDASISDLGAGQEATRVVANESWADLAGRGLATGDVHSYTLELIDDDDSSVVSTTSGRFYLGESGGGGVSVFDASHSFTNGGDVVAVDGTLINTNASEELGETVQFEIVDDVAMDPVNYSLDVPGFGGTSAAQFEVNVSGLQAGGYDYEVRHVADDGTVTDVETGTFWINVGGAGGTLVGNVSVEAVDPSDDYLLVGDPFNASVQLYNTANATSDVTVSLDVGPTGNGLTDQRTVTIGPDSRVNVTPEISGSAIAAELETRRAHEYTVRVEQDGADFNATGSFVLLEHGFEPRVEHTWTSVTDDTATINATFANHGVDNGSANASLTLYDSAGGELGSADIGAISLDRAQAVNRSFTIQNASALAGTYNYTVEYGGHEVEGVLAIDGIVGGDSGVSIAGEGNGTVTVLGTEVHGFRWAPISVSATVANESGPLEHTFENHHETDLSVSEYGNATNLNTPSTQTDTYEWTWDQGENETTNVTVGSTLWDNPFGPGAASSECPTDRLGQPEPYDYVDGYRLPKECTFESASVAVDARAGDNPSNVRVLLDGDEVPLIPPAYYSQRGVQEILNQEGGDRVNDSTSPPTLDLAPNEALFFFELTNPGATWEQALNNAEEDESANIDYNDAIVLVEFDAAGPGQVVFDVTSGGFLSVSTTDPDLDDGSTQSVGNVTSGDAGGTSGEPSTPQPQNPDPGDPSQPDQIDVDVGTVVVG